MFLPIIRTTLFSITALLSTQSHAIELNLNLVDKSALTMLTDSDWDILRVTAKDALNNSSDGSSHIWKNNDTTNAGVITLLSSDENNGNICRNTRFINSAGELTSTTIVNLCKQDDRWVEESLRLTTTVESDLPRSSPSIMLNDTLDSSTEVTTKTLGQTSEYCRELFQNIENLTAKPARRSVAIDLHKAECLR